MFKKSESTKDKLPKGGEGTKGKEKAPPAGKEEKPTRKTPASPVAKSTKPKSTKKTQDEITERKERYEAFVKKLNALIVALRKRHECMIHSRKADHELFHHVAAWTSGTPLGPSTAGGMDPSYATINKSVDSSSRASEDKYEEKIIDYAVEWQKLVALKFSSELEEFGHAKRDAEHYRKKVDRLHGNRGATTKGKEMSPNFAEKVERNEEKLEQANKSFDKHKRNLIRLVDELVDQSWKDLYPLIVLMFEFDVNNAQNRAMILADLHDVMRNLSTVAEKFGIHQEKPFGTDVWRSLRSDLQEASSASERESTSRSDGRKDKPSHSSAFDGADIDFSEMTNVSPKEKLATLVETASSDKDGKPKPRTGESSEGKNATDSSKGRASLKSALDTVDADADATSFTEEVVDEELLESAWASADEVSQGCSCDEESSHLVSI